MTTPTPASELLAGMHGPQQDIVRAISASQAGWKEGSRVLTEGRKTMSEQLTAFDRYPELQRLRGLVPEDVVEREVRQKAPAFDEYSALARTRISTVKLCEVFPAELERGRIVLENFLGQWGNVTVEEVCKICLIARYLRPKAVFEFGTFNGSTTLQMAMNAPEDCRVYTLDLPPGEGESTTFHLSEIDRFVAAKKGGFQLHVGHYFRGTPYESRIAQLWGDSARFDFSPYRGKTDLIFIDGAHSYEYVKSDSQNAFAMLAGQGVILWHNFSEVLWPGVLRYLCELSEHQKVYHLRNTHLAVYYRPGR